MTDQTIRNVAVVTGASSGLGKATARQLLAMGWHVIAQGRDPGRSAAAEAELRAAIPAGGRLDMIRSDLALLADTARMADEIAALTDRVDVLLNNAGGMRSECVITTEGNEACFAGNHLGHFLLTNQLMPLLSAAGRARVISTTSDGHFYSKPIDWDDLQAVREWNSGASYCLVKLYNILFTRALATRGAADGIVAHALHPGVVASNFTSHVVASTKAYMDTLDAQPATVAAQPLVWLAAAPEAGRMSGLYWNKREAEAPSPAALDADAADKLWRASEMLIADAGF